ncbi:MAG: hypothetical protein EAX96_14160 [Candidatus Lokiarchaeota archaeon]|nr:hypothetical protein [Candidatus Lokiarchaeota archaeon]
MSKQRKLGTIILLAGLICAFVYGVMLIISYLVIYIIPEIIQAIRILYISMLILAIIVLSSVRLDKPKEEIIDKKSRKYMKFFLITLTFLIVLGVAWIFVPNLPLSNEVQTAITAFFLIFFALFMMISLPHVADKLVSDQKGGKFILLGLHIHENFMGMIFMVNGIIFILFAYNLFDTVAGIMFLSVGAFLVGRDAEDVRNFQIIVRAQRDE